MTTTGVVDSCVRVQVLSAASLPRSRGGSEDSSWFVEAKVSFFKLDTFSSLKPNHLPQNEQTTNHVQQYERTSTAVPVTVLTENTRALASTLKRLAVSLVNV